MGAHRGFDISEVETFSERVDQSRVPGPNRLIVERHRPTRFSTPYHHHASVEINFLTDCELRYSFSGAGVDLLRDRLTLFWGATPHRVTDVRGSGWITNIYVSLGQFLRWGLPEALVEAVLSGCVVSAQPSAGFDRPLFDRLYAERLHAEPAWRKVHLSEVETRLRRVGLDGWQTLLSEAGADRRMRSSSGPMLHVEAMLRFIAENFSRPITAGDVVDAANLSQGHAMKLFRQAMGASIKEQLTRSRLSHARMLLSHTNEKILTIALDSGFKSLSSFYAAFWDANGVSPGRYRQDLKKSGIGKNRISP